MQEYAKVKSAIQISSSEKVKPIRKQYSNMRAQMNAYFTMSEAGRDEGIDEGPVNQPKNSGTPHKPQLHGADKQV